jgi:formylmethanofuran dehydrogenase subunit C
MQHAILLAAVLAVITAAQGAIERTIERSFAVGSAPVVEVDISGGPIHVEVGASGTVAARLEQRIRADDDAGADAVLARYETTVAEVDGRIVVKVERRSRGGWGREPLQVAVRLTVPADSRLNLDTSGGSIVVRGNVSGDVVADTSGGSITVDGGAATLNLDTSGGSIRVGQALSTLRADTSGGSITVDYVGPAATSVLADTSGGSITVGLDPAGRFSITGDTSGGGVTADGLTLDVRERARTRLVGDLNGGGARVVADTSGGTIRFRPASAP